MNFTALNPLQQWVLLLASMILLTSFIILAQDRVIPLIKTFAWQGTLLALTTLIVGIDTGSGHLLFAATLTLCLKGPLIPWMLHRLVVRLDLSRERQPGGHPVAVLLGAGALVIFCYHIVVPIVSRSELATRNVLAVSMAVVLLGMLQMISRHRAITQVIGFMAMENGLFFAAVAATQGMPMVVELGIAFDVLVAAILFGVIFFQIRDTFESLDVDRLNQLSEREP